jgi:hypothetical protein
MQDCIVPKTELPVLFCQKCEDHAVKNYFLKPHIPVITNTTLFILSPCKAVANLFLYVLN